MKFAQQLITEHFALIFSAGSALLVGTVLFIGYTFWPKRMRKTVNYILNSYAEAKQAKEHPEEKIEVPDFETKQVPKVPDPRISGEKQP